MVAVNAIKAFDEQSLDPKVLEGIQPLIEFLNQNFDQLIRALSAQLTLNDNIKGRIVTVSAMANVAAKIENQGVGVTGISVLKCDGDGVKGLQFSADNSGSVSVTMSFMNAIPVKTRSLTYATPYSTVEVQSSLAVKVGDTVSVTGYATKPNNGEFLVVGKTSNTLTLYSASGATESKADFTGTGESPKQVTLFLFS